jgi:dimethylargininase
MSATPHSGRAITRAVPDSFPRAIVPEPPAEPIRVDLARRQHHAYVEALESLGLAVTVLPAADEFPDCCFVEDCAVVADGVALITRPGAPSRQGEEAAVAEALRPYVRLERMTAPATLDGGDCLRLGRHWYVGRSERTNEAGARRLREVFGPLGFDVVEVPVAGHLHLKSVCSPLDGGRVLLAEGTVPPQVFGDARVIAVSPEEAYAANCVAVNGTALIPAGFPKARRAVEAAGLRVRELEMSQTRKAGGAMTCLSVLV